MKPTYEQIQNSRARRADVLRRLRGVNIDNETARTMAPRAQRKPRLSDAFPGFIERGAWCASRDYGDGESFTNAVLIPKTIAPTEDDVFRLFPWSTYYGGPGRSFTHDAYLQESRYSWLLRQSGGLDI